MATRHTRQGKGGLRGLGQDDWAERGRRLRAWVRQNQNVAVYQGPDGCWSLALLTPYTDAGILGCYRFSEQRKIASSILGL